MDFEKKYAYKKQMKKNGFQRDSHEILVRQLYIYLEKCLLKLTEIKVRSLYWRENCSR